MSLKVNYVQLCLFWHILLLLWRWPLATPIQDQDPPRVGVPPGRVACVRTSHERTRQIDETFKYYINLAWHRKYKDSMHLALGVMTSQSSSQSQSANDSRDSALGISSASANETNDDERVNESGERGQFVHFKESFVRTDSFANEPTLMHTSRCRKQPEYDQLQIPFAGQAHPPSPFNNRELQSARYHNTHTHRHQLATPYQTHTPLSASYPTKHTHTAIS